MVCPNCSREHSAAALDDACFLSMLLVVVNDRRSEPLTDAQIAHVFEEVGPDYLWDEFGGPAADYIEGLIA